MPDRIGYRLLLPPGWAHLPLTEDALATIPAFAAEVTKNTPVQFRAGNAEAISTALTGAVRAAIDHHGQDLYYPTRPLEGLVPPLTIIVAVPPGPAAPTTSPGDELLAFAAGHDDARALTVDGELAVRRTVDVPATKAGDLEAPPARRLTTLIAGPTGSILVVGTIPLLDADTGPTMTEGLEAMYDGIVSTIRFERPGAA